MRDITAYIVGYHKHGGRHMKRMYVIRVSQFMVTTLQNKKTVLEMVTKVQARLVGNTNLISESDDFNSVLSEFIGSVFRKEYREIETKYWVYTLYTVQEDGRSMVMR